MINVVVALSLILFVNFGGANRSCERYIKEFDKRTVTRCETAAVNLNVSDGKLPKSLAIDVTVGKSETVSLNLKSIDNFLANESTPVMVKAKITSPFSQDFRSKFQDSSIQKLAENLLGYELYHDKDQLASMMIYRNFQGKFVMEGVVDHNLLRYSDENDEYFFVTTNSASIKTYTDPGFIQKNSTLWKLPVSYGKSEDHVRVFKLTVGVETDLIVSTNYWRSLKDLLLYFNAVSLTFSQFQSQRILLQIAAVIFPENPHDFVDNDDNDSDDEANGNLLEDLDQVFIDQFEFSYHQLEYHAFVGMINQKESTSNSNDSYQVSHQLNCNLEQKRTRVAVTYPHQHFQFGFIELAVHLTYLLPDPLVDPSGTFLECLSLKPTVVNEIYKGSISVGMIAIIAGSSISVLAVVLLILFCCVIKFNDSEDEPDDTQPAQSSLELKTTLKRPAETKASPYWVEPMKDDDTN